MYTTIKTTVVAVLVFAGDAALACQPCPNSLPLEQELSRAAIVITGTAGDPAEHSGKNDDYMTIRVDEVLKGKMHLGEIKVRSWYGMCPYGLFLDKGAQAVIALTPRGDGYEIDGCGASPMVVTDGSVKVGDERMTVANFKQRFLALD